MVMLVMTWMSYVQSHNQTSTTMLHISINFADSIKNNISFVINKQQGKPKKNFNMVRPFFASKGTTLESMET